MFVGVWVDWCMVVWCDAKRNPNAKPWLPNPHTHTHSLPIAPIRTYSGGKPASAGPAEEELQQPQAFIDWADAWLDAIAVHKVSKWMCVCACLWLSVCIYIRG